MRAVAVLPVVVVLLLFVAVILRRERLWRARVDRHGLDDLRRIYRHDNPRGPGLDPLIRDQQRSVAPKGRTET